MQNWICRYANRISSWWIMDVIQPAEKNERLLNVHSNDDE